MQSQPLNSNNHETQTFIQRTGRFLAVYGLWTISAALMGLILFYFHQVILGLLFGRVDPWILRAVRNFGLFILGGGWLGLMMLSESYCRRHLNPKTQLIPLVKIVGIEIVIYLAMFGLQLAIN